MLTSLLTWPENDEARTERRVAPDRTRGAARTEVDAQTPLRQADTVAQRSRAEPAPARAAAVWRVIVVGRDGKPARTSFELNRGKTEVRTGPDGSFELPARPQTLRRDGRRWFIREPVTHIELDTLLPLVIDLIDPETGHVVARRAGHVDAEEFLHGLEAKAPGRVVVPFKANAPISRHARSARATLPAWPEARVELLVSDRDGPAAGVEIESVYLRGPLLGLELDVTATSDARGMMRIRGLPEVPGESLNVFLQKNRRSATVVLPLRRGAIHRATVDDPEWSDLVWEREEDEDVEWFEEFSLSEEIGDEQRVKSTGSLLVRVFRHDGRPAAGVPVSLASTARHATTSPAGVAEFVDLEAGEHKVWARGDDFLFCARAVHVRAGRCELVLVEPKPRFVLVRVVGPTRRPAPFAAIEVRPPGGGPYVKITGGEQQITHLTDRRGELRIGPFAPGVVAIEARHGSRYERVKVNTDHPVATIQLP